ncbi:TPA: ATP-binding protein [Klebsiella pneumoniae]|uniref:ATP-binding protein n=1 Tax=Raoultella TaxID=160674 RepID=UPI000FD9BA08|nr:MULTISPECIES: ATP-binding protein [Raoultella]HBQ8141730.1 ATP-binding protein [Klebsiella pneumoniae]RVS13041.1 AAA family ATPase [Raoultella ornithinolytica]TCW07853.1 phage DNA replication protein (predicted replicative helicase loader) [Raoultella sp. BIGb0138]HBQ8151936.1 ATP-binding protein [Klebsiella pneumoniae]HBQ8202944.1 ATP-binding protein [Klebsiella pneumoniae]
MLNLNQQKARHDLKADRERLAEELNFALEHKLPWGYSGWNSGNAEITSCEKHGDFERFTLVGKAFRGGENFKHSQCPACLRAQLAEIDAELRALRVADLMDNAGIARRFEECEFENYRPVNQGASKNLAGCRHYAENWPQVFATGKGLVMTGNCGTGKNHLAISTAKAIIRNHLARVEITDVMRVMRAVKSTWRHNSETTEDGVLEHYASLDLLIIDEVGVQFGSASELAILQEIINARYESILPTILISNLTFEQLKDSIGERIVDRVTNGGRNRLAFNWESFRGNDGVPE